LHGSDKSIKAELEKDLERLDGIAQKLVAMRSKKGVYRLLWQSFTLQANHRLKLNHSGHLTNTFSKCLSALLSGSGLGLVSVSRLVVWH
jgi:hypothetical protein